MSWMKTLKSEQERSPTVADARRRARQSTCHATPASFRLIVGPSFLRAWPRRTWPPNRFHRSLGIRFFCGSRFGTSPFFPYTASSFRLNKNVAITSWTSVQDLCSFLLLLRARGRDRWFQAWIAIVMSGDVEVAYLS